MVEQVYRPRRLKESPLWQCLCAHIYDFVQAYPEKYGFLKPVVEDVVNKYLECGDLTKGFGASTAKTARSPCPAVLLQRPLVLPVMPREEGLACRYYGRP